MWTSLINYFDSTEGVCPVAHSTITAHIGVLLDKNRGFLCSLDHSKYKELVPVPGTIDSECRTSNTAPHLISDNLSYVGSLPGFEVRHAAYLEQLSSYVRAVPEDVYACTVFNYVKQDRLMDDIRDNLSCFCDMPVDKINIIFCLLDPPTESVDMMWTDYYLSTLPKNGICSITGKEDHIPSAYPARILSPAGFERLFLSGCGFGYIASQKIIHSLQHLIYVKNNQHSVLKSKVLEFMAEIGSEEATQN